jgi:hypothetical protein
MRDQRHARQKVLERTDEQPIPEWLAAGRPDRAIGLKAGSHLVNPGAGVLVASAVARRPIVIELQVVVRVDEAGKNERTLEIDDGIPGSWRIADSENPSGQPYRFGLALRGHHPAIDQCDRTRPARDHSARAAMSSLVA